MALGFFSKKQHQPEAQKSSATGPVLAFHGAGRPVWSARDTPSLTRTGFTQNPIGFRCVKMIAEAAAAVPWKLKGQEGIYLDHPMLDLVERPNDGQNRISFLENLIGQYLLSGDGYVEGVFDELGLPRELYALRSDRMQVVLGKDGWPTAYDYAVGGRKHRFDLTGEVKPILHIKAFHPLDDHYGLSPISAAASAIDVHNSASKWSKSLLDNAARPSGAIVYKGVDGYGNLGSDQYDRLLDEIEMNHQGAGNAGRPMLLEGGLDWKPMGFSPNDMEFQKTKESAAREIALAFGIPPMLLGLPGDSTYNNYAEANRAFYRTTILPLVSKIAGSFGQWFGDQIGEKVTLLPDIEAVSALAPERDARWARIAAADFLTDDEKRELLDLAVGSEGP